MKRRKYRVQFAFICLLVLNHFHFIYAQTDLSEGWEIRTIESQSPDKVMAVIGVKPGMVIGEVGAGRGRFTVYLSRKVGPEGKIYANDINKDALDYLKERCTRLGFGNVETILGENENALFPNRSLDMIIMVWVYHMIEKPDNLLKNLKASLKPGATLVILDPSDKEIDEEFNIDRNKPGVSIPTIRERIENSAKVAGYELIRVETFLPKDLIFILKPLPKYLVFIMKP